MGSTSIMKRDTAVQKKPWIAIMWFTLWGLFQAYAVASVIAGTWIRPEAFPEEAYYALMYPDMFFIPLYLVPGSRFAVDRPRLRHRSNRRCLQHFPLDRRGIIGQHEHRRVLDDQRKMIFRGYFRQHLVPGALHPHVDLLLRF